MESAEILRKIKNTALLRLVKMDEPGLPSSLTPAPCNSYFERGAKKQNKTKKTAVDNVPV